MPGNARHKDKKASGTEIFFIHRITYSFVCSLIVTTKKPADINNSPDHLFRVRVQRLSRNAIVNYVNHIKHQGKI